MTEQNQPLTLSKLSSRLVSIISSDPYLSGVWIVAETVDVRVNGGHCYLELIEKDQQGRTLARARATIWANTYRSIAAQFYAATGEQFRSDLKVMVYVAANYHPVYGLSLNISGIDPKYTLGDAMRRRAEMVAKLKSEGIIDMNRSLPWPKLVQRIAVISAHNAAGYGDFINQLFNNPLLLKFNVKLFSAMLQGDRTSPSIIAALDAIAAQQEKWDCVVIIRGGGATSDLAAFDDYDLASHIANFPLPVIIGIGHERDITLLDYVANMRVKTPTAAAEWLVQRGSEAMGYLQCIASSMLQAVTDRLGGCHRQLAYLAGQLPALSSNVLVRAQRRLINCQAGISAIADRRLRPQMARLDGIEKAMEQSALFAVKRSRQRLDAAEQLLKALSPEATLRRGYTITWLDGKAVTDPSTLKAGDQIETQFANGTAKSTVNN